MSAAVIDTFVLEREYPRPPERVFRAFADPVQKRRWFGEGHQHDVDAFDMDFRTGGRESVRYIFRPGSPFPGAVLASEGVYLDIVTDRRIALAGSMAIGDHIFSATLVTIELTPNGTGTKLTCTHQGSFFKGADGPQMRRAGWEKLLDQLALELAPQ